MSDHALEAMPDVGDPAQWISWTTLQQGKASDPNGHAWVSANAGSGKTHVLTQRVIRLLLAGARPSAILCLTYTKAAAAEMSNRVFEKLSEWATLPDSRLSNVIASIEGVAPNAATLASARQLFARALDTPGGLKIQTIHAFCEALLHQFPLEANVAGHFSVLDDRAASVLLSDSRRSLLTATTAEQNPDLAEAFATALDIADDTGLETLLTDIVSARSALRHFLKEAENNGGVDRLLRQRLSLHDDDTESSIAKDYWPLPGLEGRALSAYIDLAEAKGGVKASETAHGLKLCVKETDPVTRAALLEQVFLKKDGQPYADGSFFAKAMVSVDANLPEKIAAARSHIVACRDRMQRMRMMIATRSALILADRLIRDYEELKRQRGQLDFEDLIERTATLLTKADVSAWVHYKLDQGIDHILVDEAQDTSPIQWSVIKSLQDDFFSGSTSRDTLRTFFAVGDEKQSIYSFQGARPERFSAERAVTRSQVQASGQNFSPVTLPLSFRSTDDVLSAVDQVFSVPENARGLSASAEAIVHRSSRIGQPGQVDVWDSLAPDATVSEDDWTAPFDATPESAPSNRLANRIADLLGEWIDSKIIFDKGVPRHIQPGDILVLVRKRDSFVGSLTRALKKRGTIPVAGADRLVLTSHIAVQDLMALGRFVLLPQDDLSLTALLKSPLVNLTEEDVFQIAGEREDGDSVWDNLQSLALGEPPRYAAVYAKFQRWLKDGRSQRVYDFYAGILGPQGGRARYLARLGTEVSDILDEVLTFTLDHEANGLPGLQSFISTLELEAPEVKREQDKGRNEVRIMTVHAAKGLEAPIVFLVDGSSAPFNASHVPKLRLVESNGSALPVWLPGKAYDNALTQDDMALRKAQAEDEYRRLLYVGMTRAADHLIVCGYQGKRPAKDCWHAMVTAALQLDPQFCSTVEFSAGGEQWPGLTWQKTKRLDAEAQKAVAVDERRVPSVPDSLAKPLPPFQRLPRPLSPSGAGAFVDSDDGATLVPSRLFAKPMPPSHASERGRIVHRFLQVLPTLPADERYPAAELYLERACPFWKDAEREDVLRSVFAILDNPDVGFLFSENSRAEVSIMGTVSVRGQQQVVSGRIDRLSVDDDRVVITDFKTNRQPPETLDSIPYSHLAQLALYREILLPLYPQKTVGCALIYTSTSALFLLPDALMRETLAALTTK